MSQESDKIKRDRSSGQERRGSPRYPFTATCEAVETRSGVRVAGRMSDIGRGGCYIDTIGPLPVGSDVTLRVNRDNESFKTTAKVVFSQMGMGMGLAFTNGAPEQLWILEKWLGDLSGEMPSLPSSPEHEEPESATRIPAQDPVFVVNELILLLIRKGVVSEEEGKALLQKLLA
ncbi:MAG TPA: PilZ domain-containing protein [Candidatus Acidoferrales bacterium]|nr:PilZ domain-containing protein [Candidatus Acidoferrales bacterium]